MRFLDLLTMSINNLRRRKVRTALTVLGVVIGTASVVVMVSLGIGLNALMMEMYSSYGSMTAIEIYNYGNNGNNGTNDNPLYLTDDTVKHFTLSDPLYKKEKKEWLKLYIPARTAVVLRKTK